MINQPPVKLITAYINKRTHEIHDKYHKAAIFYNILKNNIILPDALNIAEFDHNSKSYLYKTFMSYLLKQVLLFTLIYLINKHICEI